MSPKSSPTTKTLGQRLARLQDPVLGYSMEEIRALPFEELAKFRINFGRTKKGMTFMEAVEGDLSWTRWCTEHLAGSGKPEHEAFLHFVEQYVIQGEATEAMLAKAEKDNVPVPKASTAAAKAGSQVPKPKARHTSGPFPEEDPWAMVECQEIRSRGPSPSGPLFAGTHGADGACSPAGPWSCPAPGIQESVKQLQQLQSECQEVKAKLMNHQGNFECPKLPNPEPEVLACTENPATVCQTTPFISPLRQTLEQSHLPDSLENTSQKVGAACWEAFRGAEEAAWEVFQDSMLTYGFPQEPQLDLLEIYAYPDSRLTACVQESGGKAMRFTK